MTDEIPPQFDHSADLNDPKVDQLRGITGLSVAGVQYLLFQWEEPPHSVFAELEKLLTIFKSKAAGDKTTLRASGVLRLVRS
ncbi:hypothetical protein ACVIHI_008548 [Bradyrhizobium sp. USDA 4524]|uniref:hypothetical protein n=1 Tax=unclassified Bradyrhizobium TaxID=2631580 RepID=UPI00209F6097|nr:MULTISPECIES: hypothetical protein [unclassified Bradyrhizobium]MCP1845991.1 hypothetical protein [Bradyrhizobium sp. USDA 4538]MCP1907375.1 hypothetical protein [Bradyrhizobium sp. USDA 4537]MCP1985161.1 hypothetical protein [Bradyrhizobium sp. USDA 4539]